MKTKPPAERIALMKKTFFMLVSCLLSMILLAASANASYLPEPAEFNTDVAAPSFSMTAIGGQVLTSENFGKGKNMLLVYGRVSCYNTQSFLYGIQEELDYLAANGITILVGLHDNPEDELMSDFSDFYGGVNCCKVSNDYYESGMWTGLAAVGYETGSVTFPVVFLRTANGRFRYYSTGYINDPLSVVSAAVAMSSSNPLKDTAEIILPDDLIRIEAEAFRNSTFSSVYCNENVTSVGAYAFADNTALKWVCLPSSVKSIDETAFSGCSRSLIIYGDAGSYAQQFADNNGLTFHAR